MLKYIITLSLILSSYSLNALSYQQQVAAYEEALENQNVAVYKLKCQREEERKVLMREGFRKMMEIDRQKEIDENLKRLSQ
jgi:hypothetical protein